MKVIGSQWAVRMLALRAGCPLPRMKIPGIHFCYVLSRIHSHNARQEEISKSI
jgi:hypothetical protein